MSLLDQLTRNISPGPHYEAPSPLPSDLESPVRLIAYYLPQFHPIPENDGWWGRGFTEWTNVTKAIPRFEGHYQPHLPGELGFYDLRHVSVLERQAEMVRQYGLHGLCFHHYWFNGLPLLDTPIRTVLANPAIDLKFCLNWANEPWSRRWDGQEQDVLMPQHHSAEDDIAFAASLLPFFRDPRYITVNGRPLLMVYRPSVMPNARATIRRWRDFFTAHGMPEPYCVMAQAFDETDPRPYDMDASAGFPPHNSGFLGPQIQHELARLDPAFTGTAVSYDAMVEAALAAPPASYRTFPGVCPSWDNEARRPGRGFVAHGATPAKYEAWLRAACNTTLQSPTGERIVFINAWNEWAEGAHLEPDRHFGYAWLRATARVVAGLVDPAMINKAEFPADRRAQPRETPNPRRIRQIPALLVKNAAFQAAIGLETTAAGLKRICRKL